jgi:hypothetical protein
MVMQRSSRFATLGVRTAMFLAIFAFMVQGVLVWNSQMAAATGLLPEPAVTISGSVHYHDALAGNVHDHAGENGEGHVHDVSTVDHDDDHMKQTGCVSICSLFVASVSFPSIASVAAPASVATAIDVPPSERRPGIDPAALTRPPSTSSIA